MSELTAREIHEMDQQATTSRIRLDRDLTLPAELETTTETAIDVLTLGNVLAANACCVPHLADAYARALIRLNAHNPSKEI